MKTALLKTDIWDDDKFFEMNIDTKLVYMILMACPERGVGRIYKVGNRILCFRSGLNEKQLEVCKQQIEELGLIYFAESYVYLTDVSSFCQPVKGKLTKVTLENEIRRIPKNVLLAFKQLVEVNWGVEALESDRWLSGESPVYVNDNDIVNVKDNVNSTSLLQLAKDSTPLPAEAVRLSTLLQDLVTQNFDFIKPNDKNIENWAVHIEKINRLDHYEYILIEAVIRWACNDPFWKQNIRSGEKLRTKFEQLLINVKSEQDNKKVQVF